MQLKPRDVNKDKDQEDQKKPVFGDEISDDAIEDSSVGQFGEEEDAYDEDDEWENWKSRRGDEGDRRAG